MLSCSSPDFVKLFFDFDAASVGWGHLPQKGAKCAPSWVAAPAARFLLVQTGVRYSAKMGRRRGVVGSHGGRLHTIVLLDTGPGGLRAPAMTPSVR